MCETSHSLVFYQDPYPLRRPAENWSPIAETSGRGSLVAIAVWSQKKRSACGKLDLRKRKHIGDTLDTHRIHYHGCVAFFTHGHLTSLLTEEAGM
ncbi:hypothetical protein EMPS_08170 [Entomortierella parvispora]|uniref:Uncharacterized protein n=1 Tax=Entomortierella parvispora TaxID=205924 RepID=A0A9P3HGD3_9FUNG|nr:hypothetical protein EMPS_08170 [Entomortierella parvispora]